ncbi:MAG: toll/interleukin-1 receptor domain-containing protein [Lachnospiraceae bacterium]|nr:toll/interleukin-1 receptor domain-containing protein [Lachnospiraceae bacterium]MDE7238469.1 toll/interleukin-1 receptor domain-containing protein [Lachnospiraceae bacterium]
MTFFKCKMCGGDLDVSEGMTVCECQYCGTKQTLPRVDNEQKINAMNRANHFRRQCDFDRAIEAYEKVLESSGDDAEIYWSLALCKYGIEYVDDPLTGKKIPTCNRVQYTSILEDADYLSALEKADEAQKEVYRQEAESIAAIQKGILDISYKEEPFDVFLCYKETDEAGDRTKDSVLAQDIYYGLTEKGLKVFFARITLEEKLGTEYEPYIFAALNSARVMIVVGTKPEFINAVWVKNEWSRFLMLMQKDRTKLIIPAYWGMDPYDLPDALSVYQSQDMSKLGFMQDLIRGVLKVLDEDDKDDNDTAVSGNSELNSNIIALIKRGNLALEDAEWDRAFDFFDQVLNNDAECAEAYLGQVFAKNQVSDADDFVLSILNRTEHAEPTRHTKRLSKEQIDTAEHMLEENLIPTNILMKVADKLYDYDTYSESRQKQYESMELYFQKDKLFTKAVRFAKGDTSELVHKVKDRVLTVMKERLSQAREEDVRSEEQMVQTIEDAFAQVLQKVESIIARKESKYNKLVEDYKNGALANMHIITVKRMFEDYRTYKDAAMYVKQIEEWYYEESKKLYELQEERREILRSFSGLTLFSKKKRGELEWRLKEVNDKIEKMENSVNGKS